MTPEPDDDIQVQVLQTTLAEIKSSNEDGDSEINCCVICLDTISEPCTSIPCSHTNFDFICLINWLQQRPTCPLCKASVTRVQYSDPHNPGELSTYSVSPKQPTEPPSISNNQPPPAEYAHFNRSRPRQRRRSPPRRPPSPDSALEFRRHIYRHNLYSLHIASNPFTRYLPSPPSPTALSSTPHLVSRARLWLRRELSVFTFLNSNREFLLEYVVAILKTVDIHSASGSGRAESMLSDFLCDGDHARLFLHELKAWLRSPARTLEVWDREVKYPDVGRKRIREGERTDRAQGGEEQKKEEDEEARRRTVERGTSWEDEGGDHWRPGSGNGGEKRKRRRVRAQE
ncbi:E3 ubiquitin-protein ligase [Cladorrhinum samala]|uniref:RING-type E3 ubiquitin transferase n=1 Tax=Cladorrhinum samala TaxID=585594 RepID=A0AAV9HS39_9PEZI|nr:E3 ubiquitin-protein ligase [Cladorrhinum samala]